MANVQRMFYKLPFWLFVPNPEKMRHNKVYEYLTEFNLKVQLSSTGWLKILVKSPFLCYGNISDKFTYEFLIKWLVLSL